MSDFLTPKQAAERLCISTETLRRWEVEGRIESVKTPGGHRRYRVEEVERIHDAPVFQIARLKEEDILDDDKTKANQSGKQTSLLMLKLLLGGYLLIIALSFASFYKSIWSLFFIILFATMLTFAVGLTIEMPKYKWNRKELRTASILVLFIIIAGGSAWYRNMIVSDGVFKRHEQAIEQAFKKSTASQKIECTKAQKQFDVKQRLLLKETTKRFGTIAYGNNAKEEFAIKQNNEKLQTEAELANALC